MVTFVSHSSLRKAQDRALLFPVMFPDSAIAAQIKLGKDKLSYSIVYGLAPHFTRKLQELVKECNHYQSRAKFRLSRPKAGWARLFTTGPV